MGLSIHYKGSFSQSASLCAMIEEVKDIAEVYKWKHNVFETEFPKGHLGKDSFNDKIYGITFTPKKCETICLSFLSNGKMSSPWCLEFWGKSTNKEEAEYVYMVHTKTQYAGLQTHAIIIQLLKYLSAKYFSAFELFDEGGYWETGDINVLTETFKRYNDMMDMVANALENFTPRGNEPLEDQLERVLKKIHLKKTRPKRKK